MQRRRMCFTSRDCLHSGVLVQGLRCHKAKVEREMETLCPGKCLCPAWVQPGQGWETQLGKAGFLQARCLLAPNWKLTERPHVQQITASFGAPWHSPCPAGVRALPAATGDIPRARLPPAFPALQ